MTGIDEDAAILELAGRRLGKRATLRCGSFLDVPFPNADAFVGSFALHHVRTRAPRDFASTGGFDVRALRRGGVLVTADCHPAVAHALAAAQMGAWRAHVRRAYPAARTAGLFRFVGPRGRVRAAGGGSGDADAGGTARCEIMWRRDAFAVIAARYGT